MKIHPSERLLAELLSSLGDHQAVIRHLVECEPCRDRARTLSRSEAADACFSLDYGEAFEDAARNLRDRARTLAQERQDAAGLLADLMAVPAMERALFLEREDGFKTWGLSELLIDRAGEAGIRDPAGSAELAELAIRLADHLGPSYCRGLVEDLRARAWTALGNARRLTSDLAGSEAAFREAAAHLEKGTGDPIERALLLDCEASLLRAQRRFDEAFASLAKAVGIFLRNGEKHRAGRSLVNLSLLHSYAGRTEDAIASLSRSLELIDPGQEPRLILSARHNLAGYLAEAGRPAEALRLYRETCPLYEQFPDSSIQNRRLWLKGKIDHSLGRHGAADCLLTAARDGFVAEGASYDTALVSLDLALLYAGQGRTAELKRLAAEMVPIFTAHRIHREALAALACLRQAAEAEAATLDVVTRVATYLRKAQDDPELRWEGAES